MGLYTPIYPLKGYSIAFHLPPKGSPERPPERELPQRIVFDKYTYSSRLGDEVRVTSVGEFCGWKTRPDADVDAAFRHQAKLHMPQLSQFLDATPTRCGLRPFAADGILLVGRIPQLANLSVNVGPGFNGWKVAIGAGRVLANALAPGAAEAPAAAAGTGAGDGTAAPGGTAGAPSSAAGAPAAKAAGAGTNVAAGGLVTAEAANGATVAGAKPKGAGIGLFDAEMLAPGGRVKSAPLWSEFTLFMQHSKTTRAA
ncbi:unnamed protein product [Phaeothamnion confervicola]